MNYIKGTYIKNIYNNEENGYTVGVIKIKETDLDIASKEVYFTGTFYDLRIKNNYILHGELIDHPKYGTQFNVTNYEILLPSKKEELIEFLSSDLFPIGIKTATRIVDRFEEESLNVILNNKEQLQLIPKLPKTRIDKIYNILLNYQNTSNIVMDLSALGFSTQKALSIVNKYKTKTMDIINDNIYSLIDEMDFNFKDIDVIALNRGIEELDDRRIQALIIYTMNDTSFNTGNTYLEFDEILNAINEITKKINSEILEYNIIKLNESGKIIIEDNKYYLKEFYMAEHYIKDRLCYLNDLERNNYPNLEEKIEEIEKKNNIEYDEIQKSAIVKSINNNITIITGGPGTGKTTIINTIVKLIKELFKAKDEEIALLAPTGRAAKKLSEVTKLKASTIHKYLSWDKEKNKFSINEYNPNKEKYIIVDEVSMLDTLVTEALLKGIKRNIKLILVGDYYQLPSVAQGQVLKDIIDSELFDVVKLEYLYRQNEESYIPILANEIKEKDISESFITKKDDYNFISCSNTEVIPTIEYIVEKAIKKGYDETSIQVLAPIYKSINGIDNLNKSLQRIFNPPSKNKKELQLMDITYRTSDKILQLVNDNDLGLSNGDIGYIVDIIKNNDSKKTEIIIDFDGNYITYTSDKFINIRHGYAISIHKSQGNEFPMVIMPIVNNYNRMLYNKLIYTAVTRAKKSLIILGSPQCFINGVKNDYVENRKTTLKELIINNYNK